MDTITLKIQADKKEAFIQMLDLFEFVELVENESERQEAKPLYYDPHKMAYTVEDIQAIADHFPEDHIWTYQDIEDYFPEDLPIKVEIIHNKLYIMPSPNLEHQEISNELSFQMTGFIKKHKLGKVLCAPMDTKLDENNIIQPDILFIAVANYGILGKKIVEGSPDLVVEIWSLGNAKGDKALKQKLYENKGIVEYWQIQPKTQKVQIEILNENNEYEILSEATETGVVKSKILSGFEVDIETLFVSE